MSFFVSWREKALQVFLLDKPLKYCQHYRILHKARGVAQLGSASALGAEGRWFESSRPDQIIAGGAGCFPPHMFKALCARRTVAGNGPSINNSVKATRGRRLDGRSPTGSGYVLHSLMQRLSASIPARLHGAWHAMSAPGRMPHDAVATDSLPHTKPKPHTCHFCFDNQHSSTAAFSRKIRKNNTHEVHRQWQSFSIRKRGQAKSRLAPRHAGAMRYRPYASSAARSSSGDEMGEIPNSRTRMSRTLGLTKAGSVGPSLMSLMPR